MVHKITLSPADAVGGSLLLLFLSFACNEESSASNEEVEEVFVAASPTTVSESPVRPEGWTEQTHGSDPFPSHDIVFPTDEVQRLDIEIAQQDWQRMLDDMTELSGEFGKGDLGELIGAGGPPPEATEACVGMAENDACEVDALGISSSGVCKQMGPMGIGMVCMPEQLLGDPNPCVGRAEDESCTISMGPRQFTGICIWNDEDTLVCRMQPGPLKGMQPGSEMG